MNYEQGNYNDLPNTDEGREEWIMPGVTAEEDMTWVGMWWSAFSPEETFMWRHAFRAAGL